MSFRDTLRVVSSPYRDELESLRAENARLRARLSTERHAHAGVALALVAIDALCLVVVRPWLNGSDDAKFWVGLAIVVSLAVAATASAFGYKRSA